MSFFVNICPQLLANNIDPYKIELRELIYLDPDKALSEIRESNTENTDDYLLYLEAMCLSFLCENEEANKVFESLLNKVQDENLKMRTFIDYATHLGALGYTKKYKKMIHAIDSSDIDTTALYYPNYLIAKARLITSFDTEYKILTNIANNYTAREYVEKRIYALVRLANLQRIKQKDTEAGIRTLGKADSISRVFNFQKGIASTKHYLSIFHRKLGANDLSFKYAQESLDIYRAINDKKGIINCYVVLGATAVANRDTLQATEYNIKALKLAKNAGLLRQQTHLLINNAGNIGGLNKAKEDLNRALNLAVEMEAKDLEAFASYNLGAKYQEEENYFTADKYYQRAYNSFLEAEQHANIAWVLPRIVDLYVLWQKSKPADYQLKYNDEQLEEMLLNSLKASKETKDYLNQKNTYETLIKFYELRGRISQTNILRKEYIEIQKKIFEKDQLEAAERFAAEFETAEKEIEILQLESEKEVAEVKSKQFKFLAFGGMGFIAMISFFGYNYIQYQNRKKQEIQKEKFRSKLSSDLHDDVGTILTGLAMQSELLSDFVDDSNKALVENLAEMSRDAMSRMRDTVWAIDSRKDKLIDLKDRILDYGEESFSQSAVQFIFNDENLNIEKNIDPEIRQNMYLIFKEAISNILKYSNGDRVEAELKTSNKVLQLSVHDNGVFEVSKIKKSGTGLSNMKMRAEKMGGQFELDTTDGFKISVTALLK